MLNVHVRKQHVASTSSVSQTNLLTEKMAGCTGCTFFIFIVVVTVLGHFSYAATNLGKDTSGFAFYGVIL